MTSDYRAALYSSYVQGHQGVLPERPNLPRMAADVLRHLPAGQTNPAILDVGCGQGMLIRFLRANGYDDVSGIDVSADQVALALQLATPNVQQADLFEFADRGPPTCDVVVALDVIEHFDRADVQRVFDAFSRLLRPGGTLILRTPNGSSPYSGRYLFGDLTHGLIYTNRSLGQVAAITGFTNVRVYPVRPAGSGARQRIRRMLWTIIESLIVAPLVVETGQLHGHVVTQNLVCTAVKALTNEPPQRGQLPDGEPCLPN